MDEPRISSEEVDTLLSRDGEGRSAPQPFSFSKPVALSYAERQRLAGPLEEFSSRLAATLSAGFDCEVALRPGPARAESLDEALAAQPEGTCFQIATASGGRIVLAWHPGIREAVVDRLLGGSGDVVEPIPELGGVEIGVLGEVGASVARAASAFGAGAEVSFRAAGATADVSALQLGEEDEALIVMPLEAAVGTAEGTAVVLASRPFLERLGVLATVQSAAAGQTKLSEAVIGRIRVELSVGIRNVTLSLKELVGLKPGEVVSIGLEPEEAFTLSVNGRASWCGSLCERSGERAMRVSERVR